MLIFDFCIGVALSACVGVAPWPIPVTWQGILIAPERRCSPYVAADYRYPQAIEAEIVKGMGGLVYGPYSGRHFASQRETDIEHIVARAEAHDSGLCAADKAERRAFAADLGNLTLAAPRLNRHEKGAKDGAEWLPERNHCWYVGRIIATRQKYRLTIDRAEAFALEAVRARCRSYDMIITRRDE